ncbi:hypothetical protein [Neisseria sp. 74A18]|uniref:tetratricopeptide repeat protein n=1 Tax=Neisseria sp. 74A18 TaxID=1696094 RepID=UPI0006CACB08|nr:hypothetical protein [Neisseria sp. 74A18]KPN74392.1 hypothetical protein AKG43_03255 [Neisseria sp. 74A18]
MNKRLPPKLQKIQQQLDRISASFLHYMDAGDYRNALTEALKAHKLIPQSVAPLSDAATAAVKGGFWQEGITYAKKALQRDPKHINSLDALAHAYGSVNDWENCRTYGLKALELRHGSITARPALPQIEPPQNGKKIISFSLFGNSSEYLEPAVMNTELAAQIYPGWVCRFYIDGSVPQAAVQRLQANGAEIVRVDEAAEQWPGTMWRFLALDDKEAARVIFRDADSVISQREARAVAEWEAGGKRFHTMRDAGTHTELIMAGLWGAVAGSVPDMRRKIETYVSKPLVSRHFADQFFLREHIWPYACQSLCAHDRIFGFADARPFPDTEAFDYDHFHVGCNEGNSHFQAAFDLPDGSRVCWRLFSRISPLLNQDYSHNLLPQERLVCAYETTVQNGTISGMVPRRYSKGFSDGLSKITVAALDA